MENFSSKLCRIFSARNYLQETDQSGTRQDLALKNIEHALIYTAQGQDPNFCKNIFKGSPFYSNPYYSYSLTKENTVKVRESPANKRLLKIFEQNQEPPKDSRRRRTPQELLDASDIAG